MLASGLVHEYKTGMTPKLFRLLAVLVIAAIVLVVESRRRQAEPAAPAAADAPVAAKEAPPARVGEPSIHMLLGNPSGATDNPTNSDNFLLAKPQYALSYNDARGTPNWVSWRLRAADVGGAERGQFEPESQLPKRFRQVFSSDYSGSGFDRGHMCPHGDRAASADASRATFVMSNIVPQSHEMNAGAWNELEIYCRSLVRGGRRTLYITCGPAGQGGEGASGRRETIGHGKVVVPARCWKVILVVDGGRGQPDDLDRVTAGTRSIAVIMPNDRSVGDDWGKYRVSVQKVEALTGYQFFDRLPADVADGLKRKTDSERVPPPNHR